MGSESPGLEELLGKLEEKVAEVFSRYGDDQPRTHLQNLLNYLTKAVECHYQLIAAEEDGRALIKESDYHEILESYLPVLRMFSALPKSYPKSVYELGVVCTFDEVLVHHCEGQQ